MYFTRFDIENYKGIKKVRIDLRRKSSLGNVFPLVGLNESGKTTVLEAVSTFYPGREGLEAVVDSSTTNQAADQVPKARKSNFTGVIKVTAFLSMTDTDKARIQEFCRTRLKGEIDPKSLTDFYVERIRPKPT
ncbi:MAG: AAA family ATPase [Reyranella sp.]|jgi:recombinational DNA repair ATPase RecF|nr:AAA family ATPase [Reyranella sp.]